MCVIACMLPLCVIKKMRIINLWFLMLISIFHLLKKRLWYVKTSSIHIFKSFYTPPSFTKSSMSTNVSKKSSTKFSHMMFVRHSIADDYSNTISYCIIHYMSPNTLDSCGMRGGVWYLLKSGKQTAGTNNQIQPKQTPFYFFSTWKISYHPVGSLSSSPPVSWLEDHNEKHPVCLVSKEEKRKKKRPSSFSSTWFWTPTTVTCPKSPSPGLLPSIAACSLSQATHPHHHHHHPPSECWWVPPHRTPPHPPALSHI